MKSLFSSQSNSDTMTVTNLVSQGPATLYEGLTVNYQGVPDAYNISTVTPALATNPVQTNNGDLDVIMGDVFQTNTIASRSGVFVVNENTSVTAEPGVTIRNSVANTETTFTLTTSTDETPDGKIGRVRTSSTLDGLDFITEGSSKRIRLLQGTAATPTISGAITDTDISAPHFTPYITTLVSAGTTTTLTSASNQVYLITGSANQTIKLPSTITLNQPLTTQPSIGSGSLGGAGFSFEFFNASSGTVTINASDNTSVGTLAAGSSTAPTAGKAVCINTTANAAASWIFATVVAMVDVDTLTATGAPLLSVGGSNGQFTLSYSGTALPIANGGTSGTTKTTAFDALQPMTTGGDIIYGGASGTGTRLANGSTGQVLASGGGTNAPFWQSIGDLSPGFSTQATANTTTNLNAGSNQMQFFTNGTSGQIVRLPDTGTLQTGRQFFITNKDSTNNIAIQTFTGAAISTLVSLSVKNFTCISNANNNASSWDFTVEVEQGGFLATTAGGTGTNLNTGTGNVVFSDNATLVAPALGTPASGSLSNCTNIPVANATGTLAISHGGTGATTQSFALSKLSNFDGHGQMSYGYNLHEGTGYASFNDSNILNPGTDGQVLTTVYTDFSGFINGVNATVTLPQPTWAAPSQQALQRTATTVASPNTTTSLTKTSNALQDFTVGSTGAIVKLPDGADITPGFIYQITNSQFSSQPIAVQTNSSQSIIAGSEGMHLTLKYVGSGGNAATDWVPTVQPLAGAPQPVAYGGTGVTTSTGTGNVVLSSNPVFVAPTLGTVASGSVLTNATGLPIGAGTTGTLAVARGGTGVTASTGTGNVVLSSSPTLSAPVLGQPASGDLLNCTGLPIVTGTLGTLSAARGGTGSTSAATGSGSVVLNNTPTLIAPILGTPTSGDLSNCTGLSSSNFSGTLPVSKGGTGVTTSTGSGNTVLSTSPTLVTPALGTPSQGNLASCDSLPIVGGTTGTLSIARGGTGVTSVTTNPTASSYAGWDSNANLSADHFIRSVTSTAAASGTTVLDTNSTAIQVITGTTASQNVQLPATSSYALGMAFEIFNNTTSGDVFVYNSASILLFTLKANNRNSARFTILNTASTQVASQWQVNTSFRIADSTTPPGSGITAVTLTSASAPLQIVTSGGGGAVNFTLPLASTLENGQSFEFACSGPSHSHIYDSSSNYLGSIQHGEGNIIATVTSTSGNTWTLYGSQPSLHNKAPVVAGTSSYSLDALDGFGTLAITQSGTTITLPSNASGATTPMVPGWWVRISDFSASDYTVNTFNGSLIGTFFANSICTIWFNNSSTASGSNAASDFTASGNRVVVGSNLAIKKASNGANTNSYFVNTGTNGYSVNIQSNNATNTLALKQNTANAQIVADNSVQLKSSTITEAVYLGNDSTTPDIARVDAYQLTAIHMAPRLTVTTIGVTTTVTLSFSSNQLQIFSDGSGATSGQIVKLPNPVALTNVSPIGFTFTVKNVSATYSMAVQASDASAILTVSPATSATFVCVSSVATSAGWSFV